MVIIKSRFIYRKLKRLNLGGNELTSVPQKALSILDTLKKLEMQENRITKIEEGDFEGIIYIHLLFGKFGLVKINFNNTVLK